MIRSARLSAALVAAAAGLAFAAGSASAQVFSVSPSLAVPPTGTGGTATSYTVSTLTVAGGPASISDLNLIINQTHTWDSDLDIILIPPGGGSYLKVTTDNGGSGDNYTFTRFDDLASVAITAGTAPFNNNYRPEGGAFDALDTWFFTPFTLPGTALVNLGGFNGTNANGEWTLVVGDDVGGDLGVLTYWSLEFNGAVDPSGPPPLAGPQPPQASMTLSSTSGVIGSATDVFVAVTSGANPPSTGITVSCDASAIDGGTVTLLDNGVAPDVTAGDLIFSGTAIVGPSASFGVQTLTGNVLDAQGRTASATATFNVIPPPPSNDDCSNAITVVDGANDVSNVSATSDGSVVCVGSSFEVYYSYTATATTNIKVDTCAAGTFDTVLSVTDGCGGTDLGCSDDFCGVRSQVTFAATAGQTYIIRLASFGTFGPTTGTATLTITPAVPPQYTEVGDAGDLVATAQIPTGTDPFTNLAGNIEAGSDADLYLINVCDFANFGATTVGTDTTGDTQLFLFNPDGTGVTSNDDSAGGALSTISGAFLTANGNYYLGVVRYNLDPVDESSAFMWNNTPFGTERAPDGPGAAGALGGWVGTSGSGLYQVNFTGTCFAGEPVNLCNYDYNQDENVDLTDAQLMAQVAAGIIAADPSWLSGDLNLDENADLTDAQQLAQFVASGICPV